MKTPVTIKVKGLDGQVVGEVTLEIEVEVPAHSPHDEFMRLIDELKKTLPHQDPVMPYQPPSVLPYYPYYPYPYWPLPYTGGSTSDPPPKPPYVVWCGHIQPSSTCGTPGVGSTA